jgi:hypothetical protein
MGSGIGEKLVANRKVRSFASNRALVVHSVAIHCIAWTSEAFLSHMHIVVNEGYSEGVSAGNEYDVILLVCCYFKHYVRSFCNLSRR